MASRTHPTFSPPAVSAVLGLGTWPLAGAAPWGYGACDEATARQTIEAALLAGCTRIDTAALFGDGQVERWIGEVLADWPVPVHLTTRVGCRLQHGRPVVDFDPDAIGPAVDRSITRLGRVPEVTLLHMPGRGVLRDGQALSLLQSLQTKGVVNKIGVSILDPDEALLAVDAGVDWVCVPYNPIDRKMEHRLFAYARTHKVAVHVRGVLHGGALTDRPRPAAEFSRFDIRREWPELLHTRLAVIRQRLQEAFDMPLSRLMLAYALGHPAVSAVSVGCRGHAQVDAAFAAPILPLIGEERERLERLLYEPDGGRVGGVRQNGPHSASI